MSSHDQSKPLTTDRRKSQFPRQTRVLKFRDLVRIIRRGWLRLSYAFLSRFRIKFVHPRNIGLWNQMAVDAS
jgi:hypothetical protein